MTDPIDVGQTFEQAIRFYAARRLDEAEGLFQRIVQVAPEQADAWHHLGLIAGQREDWDSAESHFRQAVAADATQPTFMSHHGLALLYRGRPDEALLVLQRAVRLAPEDASVRYNLGQAYHDLQRLDEAAEQYRKTVEFAPSATAAWNNLGLALLDSVRLDEAVHAFEQALQVKPDYVAAWNNLGLTRQAQEQYNTAHQCFSRALEIASAEPSVHNNLGLVLLQQGHARASVRCFEQAIQLAPHDDAGHHNLGCAWLELGDHVQASSAFEEALRLRPGRADSLVQMGVLAAQRGQFSAALAYYQHALETAPLNPVALYHKSQLGGRPVDSQDVSRLREIFSARLANRERRFAGFALGTLLDRLGEFDAAFEVIAEANSLHQRLFSAEQHDRDVDQIIAALPRDVVRDDQYQSPRDLVFIVGMPRSGTTLIEQILSRHSDVFCRGESEVVAALVRRLEDDSQQEEWCAALTHSDVAQRTHWREQLVESLPSEVGNRRCIVDKTPDNFFYLGLIAALWPGAHIVHCRRHPLDVGLSCYFRNFDQQAWAFELLDIGAYYLASERLMQHWKQILPLSITTIEYEQLVADQESETRRLLDACGLDWEPRCLDFEESDKVVATPSTWQVRQGMYQSSCGRWRNYRKQLQPLVEFLESHGLGPFE